MKKDTKTCEVCGKPIEEKGHPYRVHPYGEQDYHTKCADKVDLKDIFACPECGEEIPSVPSSPTKVDGVVSCPVCGDQMQFVPVKIG